MKTENEDKKQLKVELGKLIKSNREAKDYSQRGLAKVIDLPNSNLKYIEDGINAPSPEVYKNIILQLNPNDKDRDKMDYLYSQIRRTPPPDICEFMIENDEVFNAIRKNKYKLTRIQTGQLNKLLESFAEENLVYMEEIDNG
ncbi:helix-turn-helix transcriptional regulator [Campylobacter ureolyticus]|uniref:helix-turn-helix domain-containing protein n=1 Tax=Campylobacter ureolyticus TaxID=827 RepID=UPI00290B533F|nr:helix-turn-helix transcriptional regulator [Campylobacter ureolyticus]MDU7069958.1 helix-turn-helix transcriptional regulator [Campylobacter ureolyticus]